MKQGTSDLTSLLGELRKAGPEPDRALLDRVKAECARERLRPSRGDAPPANRLNIWQRVDAVAPTPVVPTPNHPEYPAAHACNAAAVGAVLERYFGTSKVDFIIDSTVPGLTTPVIHYRKTGDFVEDLKLARIYGGMHYRNSTNDGATLGVRVGNFINKNYFQRTKK
jgi:hypothetical protein